jgi:phenylacetaldehyde dehydrogenase
VKKDVSAIGEQNLLAQVETGFLARPHRLLIDGAWVEARSGRSFSVVNPADGEQIAEVAWGEAADVDLAIQAARRALDGPWSRLSHAERAALLFALADLVERRADEIALIDTLDNGKPLHEARAIDVTASIGMLRECAGWATKLFGESARVPAGDALGYTLREPVGVAGLIVPWNFPFVNCVMKLAPALAAGCTTVLKPAEQTPLSALVLGELVLEAGFPPGVVNVITGHGDAGAAIAEHPGVDKVSFTGSTDVGKSVVRAASGNLKRLTLELGGKSPVVIFPDADLEQAIAAAARRIFFNAGQVCVANSRLYAHAAVFDEVVAGLVEQARAIKVGPGIEPDTQMGPLVSQEQLERVSGMLAGGAADGARALTGGGRIDRAGYFVEPTVLVGAPADAQIMREEVFGPVICASSFDGDDLQPVADAANDSRYGLAAYVWTRDLGTAHRMAGKLKAGSVFVNDGYVPNLPGGGYKQSGWGRELGQTGVEAYTEIKSVSIAY